MFWILHSTSVLKVLHLLYAGLKLMGDFKHESFPHLVLTTVMLSLIGTSAYWGWELFHRGVQETIILFNSLRYSPPHNCQLNSVLLRKRPTRTRMCSMLGFFCFRLKIKVATLMSLSLQELLVVLTPFAVKLFVPMYLLMMVIFPHWDVFTTSFIYSRNGWTWSMALGIGFELVATFCCESNILFVFFFRLALQVTHLGRLKMTIVHMR